MKSVADGCRSKAVLQAPVAVSTSALVKTNDIACVNVRLKYWVGAAGVSSIMWAALLIR